LPHQVTQNFKKMRVFDQMV